jgi:hypothetical protein
MPSHSDAMLKISDVLINSILNYVSIKNGDENDAADAKRQVENVVQVIVETLHLDVVGGPKEDGRVLASLVVVNPD